MSQQGIIKQNVTEAEYAAASATGDANITITNYYYYREKASIVPVESNQGAVNDNLPCPYRSLFHFGPNDAEVFFGREIFVEELYSATKTRNFIPILGASGSGKSSVVFAGLVPKLQKEGHWQFTHFRPGSDLDPFYALAEALVPLYRSEIDSTDLITQASKLAESLKEGMPLSRIFSSIERNHPNHRVLLIADQFEEIYTLHNDEAIRHKFLDCLLSSLITPTSSSSSAMVLVMTMRADFLGNALSYRPFADVLSNDLKLKAMNHDELREVIEQPVKKLGVTFEEGLVERILNDVEEQPGNLPLLEFALTELWNQRTGKQLTHKIYEEIGQVEGALARHADEEYEKFTEVEKEKVKQIFIQLVRPGEGTEDTRRIAIKAELGEPSWSLVKRLADARLVVTSRNVKDQETVEVVHEALILNWSELQTWMNTDRIFRTWQERLRVLKRQWEEKDKDKGSLLRGAALAEAEERLKERPDELIAEKVFIQESIEERERIEQEKAARRRREIRTAWRIAVGSLVALVVSSGLGLTAWNQTKQSQLNLADSLARNSLSLLAEGQELDASIAGIKAGKILQQHKTKNSEAMSALIANVYVGRERNRLSEPNGAVSSVSFSQDGRFLVANSDDNIKLWNLETGQLIRTFTGHDSQVLSVSLSQDGQTLVSGSEDGTIKVWNPKTGAESLSFSGHDQEVLNVSLSQDGKTLVSSSSDNIIKVWNLQTGKLTHTLTEHEAPVYSISMSQDGQTLVSSSVDGTIKVWNLQTGELIRTLHGQVPGMTNISMSQDGQTLVSGSVEGPITVWNLKTGQEMDILPGDNSSVYNLSLSPDGKTLVYSGFLGTVTVYNLQSRIISRTLHINPVPYTSHVSVSPDNKTFVTFGGKGIRVWNLQTGEFVRTLTGHDSEVLSVSVTPDDKTFVSSGRDNTIKVWDLKTGDLLHTLKGHNDSINSLSVSPDGHTLVSGSYDNTVKVWNLKTRKLIRTLTGHNASVYSVTISQDGQTLVSGSEDGTIKVWNLQTGKLIRTLLTGQNALVYSRSASEDPSSFFISRSSISVSQDGQTLVSSDKEGNIKVWNLETGKLIRTLTENLVYSISLSPDGQTLYSGGHTGITVWNLQTGKLIRNLIGHNFGVLSISVSQDGHTLVSSDKAGDIKVWNLQTGQEIRTLSMKDDVPVISVSLSNDGQLVSGMGDGTIKIWNLDFDWLMGRSCDRIRNYLKYNPNVQEQDRTLCDGIT